MRKRYNKHEESTWPLLTDDQQEYLRDEYWYYRGKLTTCPRIAEPMVDSLRAIARRRNVEL